ncbi:MAG: site-specific DNA-methyltransferase [bacterium]|nr:site-specific DNA-methyltransferase [bacterium]
MHASRWNLVHADCLTFLDSLEPGTVDVITTDPAYSGMNQHLQLGKGRIVGDYRKGEDDRWFREFRDEPELYRAFLEACHRVMKPDGHLYIMFDSFSLLSLGSLVRERFEVKNLIVWDKQRIGMGHHFRRRHECVVFATKGRRKLSRRDLPDVWSIPRLMRPAYPTQKPVELFRCMLAGSAGPDMVVCDPFVGSGSAAIAALMHGCRFVGGDVSERAIAFSSRRLSLFDQTGRDPEQKPAKELPSFLEA